MTATTDLALLDAFERVGRAELAELRSAVRLLTDRAEIAALLDRYVILLDTQDENGFDDSWPATVYAEDVRLDFPVGAWTGIPGVAQFHHYRKNKFARTHHVAANYAIELDGDRARVRMHLMAGHLHHDDGPDPGGRFDIAGYSTGEVVRTAAGWRIRRWKFTLVWSEGTGPAAD